MHVGCSREVECRDVCCRTATRSSGRWTLTLDDSAESERVDSQTDVQLDDNQAFIGGRPGHEYELMLKTSMEV